MYRALNRLLLVQAAGASSDAATAGATAPPVPTDPQEVPPGPAPDEPLPVEPPSIGEDREPPPPAPQPQPEPVVVSITGVELGLWSLQDAAGAQWLVPAYRFMSADGGEFPVMAIPVDLVEVALPVPQPLPAEVPAAVEQQ